MPPVPQNLQLPYIARLAFGLICVTIIIYWMHVLDSIVTLLLFSILFAIAMYPLTEWLEKKGVGRMLAITISILTFSLVAAGICMVLAYQVRDFSEMLPQLIEKVNASLNKVQIWAYKQFNIPPSRQLKEVQKYTSIAEEGGSVVGAAVSTTTTMLGNISIMPVYIFFLLYYRDMFKQFICKVFASTKKAKIHEVFNKIYEVVHSYLSGLLIVTLIVGTLNSIGLLILGIPSALFFGFLAAILLILPYIGILIGSILPIIVALVTKDSPMYAVGVAGIFFFVQMLEGNIITPYIVGSKISVNPLAAIVMLFLGGALWGISGLALALPLTAMLKVVFDAVEDLKPYGFLLGEPESTNKQRAIRSKKVQKLEQEVVESIAETTKEVKSLFGKKKSTKSA